MPTIKEETLKGVKWTAIEKLSLQLIQFLIGIILARLLTPSDFGLIGMLSIFISISQTFIDGGFSNALIRKIDRTEDDYSTTFYFNLIVGVVCYAILYVISPYIAFFFHSPILEDLLRIISITLFVNSLSIVQIAKLTIDIDFRSQAIATLIAVLISGTIGICLAYNNYGVYSLVWQTVLTSVIKCILVWVQAKWIPKIIFSKSSFKNLFGYGSKLLLSNLLGTFYNHMTTIVIGKFYTPKDLGYYTRGQQFAQLPNVSISDILGRVTFPILSRIQQDDTKLVGIYRKYIRLTSMLVFYIMTLIAAIAKPIIMVLLTDKWIEAVVFLQIFCFAVMFDHITKLNLNLLQVKGRSDLYLRLEVIKKIIAFTILLVSIPFGVVYICLSKIIYSQIALYVNTYYTGKLFHLGYIIQFRDFSKYLLFSFFSCIPAYLITFCNFSSIIHILLGTLMSFSIYVILLHNDDSFKECVVLFRKKINI